MPAIDTLPNTPVESRPGGLATETRENSTATDAHASDAFIAALLAQTTASSAPGEVPVETAAALGAGAGGQELPALRPTLAALSGPRRAIAGAIAGGAPPPAPVAGAEGVEEDFAAAFATLQDKVIGATGGDRLPTGAADGATGASALSLVSELASSANNAGNPTCAEQALDAIAAVHGARNPEPSASSPAYAAKPAPLPINQPALFAERLNQHISVMLGDGVQSAQIAVSPADLGPVEVRVTMVGDEAKIQLVASHATTREALHDALPRLRASFADAGLSLAQAGVFAQMPERQFARPFVDGNPAQREADVEQAPLATLTPPRALRIGLIDAFV